MKQVIEKLDKVKLWDKYLRQVSGLVIVLEHYGLFTFIIWNGQVMQIWKLNNP